MVMKYFLPVDKSFERLSETGFAGVNSVVHPCENVIVKVTQIQAIGKKAINVFVGEAQGSQSALIRATLSLFGKLGHQGISGKTEEWRYVNHTGDVFGPFSLEKLKQWKDVAAIQNTMIENVPTELWIVFSHLIQVYEHLEEIAFTMSTLPRSERQFEDLKAIIDDQNNQDVPVETRGLKRTVSNDGRIKMTVYNPPRVQTPEPLKEGRRLPLASQPSTFTETQLGNPPNIAPRVTSAIPPVVSSKTVQTVSVPVATTDWPTPDPPVGPPWSAATQAHTTSPRSKARMDLPQVVSQPPRPPPPAIADTCFPIRPNASPVPSQVITDDQPSIAELQMSPRHSVEVPSQLPSALSRPLSASFIKTPSDNQISPMIIPPMPVPVTVAATVIEPQVPLPLESGVPPGDRSDWKEPKPVLLQDSQRSNVPCLDVLDPRADGFQTAGSDVPPQSLQTIRDPVSSPLIPPTVQSTPMPQQRLNDSSRDSVSVSNSPLPVPLTVSVPLPNSSSVSTPTPVSATETVRLPVQPPPLRSSAFSFPENPPHITISSTQKSVCATFLTSTPIPDQDVVVEEPMTEYTEGPTTFTASNVDGDASTQWSSEQTKTNSPNSQNTSSHDRLQSGLLPVPQIRREAASVYSDSTSGWGTPSTKFSLERRTCSFHKRNTLSSPTDFQSSRPFAKENDSISQYGHGGMRGRGCSDRNRFGSSRDYGHSYGTSNRDRPKQTPTMDHSITNLLQQVSYLSLSILSAEQTTWQGFLDQSLQCLEDGFSDLITYAFQSTYGKLWTHVIKVAPPWKGFDILTLIFYHRTAIFNKVMKHYVTDLAEHLRKLHLDLLHESVTVETATRAVSWTKDIFGLIQFQPLRDTPAAELGMAEERGVTFEEAERKLHQAKREIDRSFADLTAHLEQLTRSKEPATATMTVEPDSFEDFSPMPPPPVQRSSQNDRGRGRLGGRGYSARTLSTPGMSEVLPTTGWRSTENEPPPIPMKESSTSSATENPSAKDIIWIRVAVDCIRDRPSNCYEMLIFTKRMVEAVANKATEMAGEIAGDRKKVTGLREVTEKVHGLVEALTALHKKIPSNDFQEAETRQIVMAIKDFITVVRSDAFKYCKKLQRPEERYLKDLQSKIGSGKSESFEKTIETLDNHYKKLCSAMP